jgi:hypothetical protein
MCDDRTVSIYYELAEKQIYSIDGDAVAQLN